MRAAVLLALALAGCAGPLAAHRERVARTAVAHEPLSLRLVNGTLRLLASGTLGDERVAWALDTGATDHWLAAGRATGRVRIAMIDISQDAAPGVESVTTGPGIGGVLSPERLVSSGGALELDLPGRTLHRLAGAEADRAIAELARAGSPVLPTSCDGGCIPTVRATVDGRDAVLLVDTGSPVTVLFSKTDAAVHAARRGIAHVLAQPHFIDDGDTYRVSTIGVIDDVGVRAGGRAMRSKSLVVIPRPDGLEEVDGLLGLDVLQQCAIVVDSGARGALACEGAPNEMEGVPAIAKAPRVKPLLVRGTVASIGDDLVTIDKVEVRGTSHAAEIESALARDDLTCDSPLEDKLDLGDQSALAELYDQGLLDAKVRHSVERHGRHVVVRFDVTDGRVYRYSGITVAGDLVAPAADYLALLRQKNGDVVNRSAIVDALDAIRAFHRKRRRPNLSVEPEVTLAPAAGTLRLVIRVTRPAR